MAWVRKCMRACDFHHELVTCCSQGVDRGADDATIKKAYRCGRLFQAHTGLPAMPLPPVTGTVNITGGKHCEMQEAGTQMAPGPSCR